MDTYKGDSPAKKLVRLQFWLSVEKHIPVTRLPHARIAFLAGREGGDASTLVGMGFQPEQLLAIDREQDALNVFCLEHPDVRALCGNAHTVLRGRDHRRAYDAVLFDTCSPLGPGVCAAAASIAAHAVRDGGILGIGVMRGREQHAVARETLAQSVAALQLGKHLAAAIPDRPLTNMDIAMLDSMGCLVDEWIRTETDAGRPPSREAIKEQTIERFNDMMDQPARRTLALCP